MPAPASGAAREMPGAYELTGGYVIEGVAVRVGVFLWHAEQEIAAFEVTGKRDDIPALAAPIVAEASSRLR